MIRYGIIVGGGFMNMTQFRELESDEIVQIGDWVTITSPLGHSDYLVTRVSKKYCYVRFNSVYEQKFHNAYGFGFGPRPRVRFDMCTYKCYRVLEGL